MEIFTGLSIYFFPEEFPAALYGALIPWFPYLSAGFVAGGIALLLMVRYPLPPWVQRAIPLLPATPLLIFARHLWSFGGLSGMINYAVTAAALLVLPWVNAREELLAPALAMIQAATGAVMLVLPERFNSLAFAPIKEILPLVGIFGIIGALALMVPYFGFRTHGWAEWARRGVAVLLPVVLTVTFIRTAAWNGVAGWSVWIFAVLTQGRSIFGALHPSGEHAPQAGEADPWPAEMERVLETWLWVMTLVVVALTALGGDAAVHSPLRSNLFVLVITVYNVIVHWSFPNAGTPPRRLTIHLLFLTVASSIIMSDSGSIHLAILPLLTLIPLAAARTNGEQSGRYLLALVVAIACLSGLDTWLSGRELTLVLGNTGVMVLVLTGTGIAGVRAAGAQRLQVHELAAAHREVASRHVELQLANAILLSQSEELTAQQEELTSQHEALIQQSDILMAQRDELEASEGRFRMAFDDAPIGMTLGGPDDRIWRVNRAFCSMLGYTESELVGAGRAKTTHPDDLATEGAFLDQMWDGKLDSFQTDKRYYHQSGQIVWTQVNVSAVRGPDGKPVQFITHVQDITERRRDEEQLLHLADYDPLTDLYNRRRFREELEQQLALSRRYETAGALLFLDLDQFKYINDSLGHRTGDQLLESLSSLLRRRLRQTDTVARLGGDEFAILLPQTDAPSAEKVAGDLLRAIRDHVQIVNGYPVGITASIGVALFPDHGTTAEELLSRADLAMYQAKESGRNGVCVYTPDGGRLAQVEHKLNWETRIREALEHDRFLLHFQPLLSLKENRVEQYELLLRLPGDDGSLIYPGVFLPIAEQFGLIGAIDRWVVKEAIRLIAASQETGTELRLNVNLSGKTLGDQEFPVMVRDELARTGIDPSLLILEVTETAAIADMAQARLFVETLQNLGCSFALDDFGSAWSSFYYLKHLPVNSLKIDGSFIERLPHDPVDQELVKAMVEVARRLGKTAVAEFVQDEQTVALLRSYGVDFAQGYHIGRPAPHPTSDVRSQRS
jgi:diguanylate cyclase (GGDEF)-like protein/PAS domain S-box-containing protein